MENTRIKKLKEKMARGEIALCTALYYVDPLITEQLASLDFDMIWIDQEHTGHSLDILRNHIQAAALTGKVSLVRVTDHDPAKVKPILELAPDAVIFPMVNTAEEARQVIGACLYPPRGQRGYGPIRAQRFGSVPMDEYIRDVESCFWRVVQIESEEGVRNLEKIIQVPGVDGVVVGPNDLSASLGLLGQYRHPEVLRLMDKIGDVCRQYYMPFGVSVGYDEQNLRDWVHRGVSWIEVGADMSYIDAGARLVLNGTKRLLKEEGKG